MFLGVVFFALLLGLAYLWFADPWNLRPLIDGARSATPQRLPAISDEAERSLATPVARDEVGAEGAIDSHPSLSPTQEEALAKIGIDAGTLPTTMTPGMEACFTEKLGVARVAEIKAGDDPTPLEVAQGLPCVGQ